MEDLFGQIECRSKSDLIVMRILRSAMDKAHEKLQSKDGPIEFLHERSTFYELAAILVEGGLGIVREETDILEDSSNKILSDLMEIRHWLEGRIQDMKELIVEKDRELIERLENESELRQALELKDRELFFLQKNEENNIQDLSIKDESTTQGEDIFNLKNSVDQQVLNIKQKLEDEKNILKTERRTRKSRVSSPNLSLDFLDKEINGSPVFAKDDSFGIKPNQNVLIRRMSSDIDVLKETLDLAFGRMQSAEVLPLEKQWRWTVERDIESILVKGFISDLQESFVAELKKKNEIFLGGNWFEFVDEMSTLCREMKDFFTRNDSHKNRFPKVRRTTSEPLPDISCTENVLEDIQVDESHNVTKMIKNHESIIHKQHQEFDWLTRNVLQQEGSSCSMKRDNDYNRLEERIQDAITRLDNFTKRSHKLANQIDDRDGNRIQEKRRNPKSEVKAFRSSNTVESLEVEIVKLKEERDLLYFQISVTEEIYELLYRGMIEDISTELFREDTDKLMNNKKGGSSPNTYSDDHINCGKECNIADDELEGSNSSPVLVQNLESAMEEDIYMVFLTEMAEAWKSERDACAIESLIREDIYQFIIIEAVKESQVHSKELESLKQLDFQEQRTPRSRRLNADNQEGTTPRSRKLENDGEESLIQKLDSLLKCLEAEEDLMLSASSEIKEHSENNSLVILNCEEIDERNAIEWLLTDDETTFGSVSEKLERALQQLYTSKELLVELEESLDVSEDLGETYHQVESNNIVRIECENTRSFIEQEDVLAVIVQFQIVIGNVEHMLHENLDKKCLRLEVLKREIDSLTKPVVLIRTRKLLYKKAFISRCHNLKLAETEVDLLGDQVESLLCLLERIYVVLNQNATVLSAYFEVYDILKLIRRELNNGRSCKSQS